MSAPWRLVIVESPFAPKDFINEAHELIIDLKSTTDASYTAFGYSCIEYRYHVQQPFYLDGLAAVGQRMKGFVFVAVEKQPPYAVACYTIDPDSCRIGRDLIRRNLETYARCHDSDIWPGYEPLRDLDLPAKVKYVPIS